MISTEPPETPIHSVFVEAWDSKSGSDFDNPKVKLYLSDDSEKSFFFSESYADVDDMDWVTQSALRTVTGGYIDLMSPTTGAFQKGSLIGYSLDSSGDIDTVDVTSKQFSGTGSEEVNFQSAKVLKTGSKSYSIDSDLRSLHL